MNKAKLIKRAEQVESLKPKQKKSQPSVLRTTVTTVMDWVQDSRRATEKNNALSARRKFEALFS